MNVDTVSSLVGIHDWLVEIYSSNCLNNGSISQLLLRS